MVEFRGEGLDEVGVLASIDEARFAEYVGQEYLEGIRTRLGEELVAVDPAYFRPAEVDLLIGDPTKAMQKLGWKPQYQLPDIITDMMRSDLLLMKKDTYLQAGGYAIKNYFE